MPSRDPRQAAPCPACLGDETRKEWQRLPKELGALGLLTALDRRMLAAYCQAHTLWTEAVSSIGRYGTMVKSPNGYPMQSPDVAVANKTLNHGADRRRVRHDPELPALGSGSVTSRPRIPSRRSCKTVARAARDDPVTAYARAVTEGQVLANRLVRLAWQRHLEDLASGAARGCASIRRRRSTRSPSSASCATPRANGPADLHPGSLAGVRVG